MIYTVTLNPALDYVVGVSSLKMGEINRTEYSYMTFGGKGLNVSAVLCRLGTPNTALGLCGGFVGKEIIRMAEAEGCVCDFIEIPDRTSRINIKIKDGGETEINGTGPTVSGSQLNMLYEKLSALNEGDILVLSGSIPKNITPTIYMDIMTRLPKGVKTVVDTTGAPLKNALKCHPFLVKPNAAELGDIYGAKIAVKTDAIFYGKKLLDAGAENVLVSMGGKGAVLITPDDIYEANAPEGEIINTVGAGDSMVAGFLAAWTQTGSPSAALHLAVAAGSATAFSPALATKDEIMRLSEELMQV